MPVKGEQMLDAFLQRPNLIILLKRFHFLMKEKQPERAILLFYLHKQILQTLKKKLWKALVTVNILEGLRFYVSFACSFAFGELKLLEGSAKIISFIARDESQHLAVSQRIINNYREIESRTKWMNHQLIS